MKGNKSVDNGTFKMGEIRNIGEQIDFNNLTYCFKEKYLSNKFYWL